MRPAIACIFYVVILLAGCEHAELTPAPSAEQVAGKAEAASTTVSDITLRVASNTWPGDPTVTSELTPLHLLIENHSDVPLRLRYQEFALAGKQGQYYAALPPLAAQIDLGENELTEGYDPIQDPLFQYDGFFVAPLYGYAYHSVPVWERDFHHDNTYHDAHHNYYKTLDVSLKELQAQALPEGVLSVGGNISGYLYFERVDKELSQMEFRALLVNADTGQTIGTAKIPFRVERHFYQNRQ